MKVMLTDIYGHLKTSIKLKPCFVLLNSSMDQNAKLTYKQKCMKPQTEEQPENMSQIKTSEIQLHTNNVTPSGIRNPSNHCYINSILQTLLCILWHEPSSFDNINNNKEGELVSLFQNVLQKAVNIENLKTSLVLYKTFFDGKKQWDCNECYGYMLGYISLRY